MAIYKTIQASKSRNRTTRALTSDQQTKARNIITNFITYFKNNVQ
jgi:hypothetical protein